MPLSCGECGLITLVPWKKIRDRGQRFCSRVCANRVNGRRKKLEYDRRRPLCACGCGLRIGKQAKLYRSGHNPSVPPPPRRGPANHRWSGGPKRPHLSEQHRRWRQRIFERDNWTCVMCGRMRRAGDRVELQAHHVVPVSSDASLALDLANGMTLCVECHRDHHWGVNRKKVG